MIFDSIYKTYLHLFEECESAPALIWENAVITRSDFMNLIHFLIHYFNQQNLKKNDIVMYFGSNHPIPLAIPFACSFLKLKYFALPESTSIMNVQNIMASHKVQLLMTSMTPDCAYQNLNTIWTNFKKISQHKHIPEEPSGNSAQFEIGFLTSGSTGSPKLILLKESHIIANIKASIAGHQFQKSDSILAVLNVCQSGGLCIQALPGLCYGIPIHLHKHFNLSLFALEVEKGNSNITLIVPSFLKLLRLSSFWNENIFAKYKFVGIGSAHLDPQLAQECIKIKVPLISIYGLTEAGPFAIYGLINSMHNGAVNIGKPALHIEAKLSEGQHGRILLKGPAVQPRLSDGMQSLNMLDEEGWLDTGDEGLLHNDDYYFTNRRTDIANIGGLKVNTLDVETVINTIENVVACAVFSRKHAVFTEVLVACIETDNPAIERKIISKKCKALLPRHMVPRNIYILNKLPRSSVGKVLKNELKKLYG